MARRRSLNRRRSRRSLNTSGILNDDTNVYEDDDELWFQRIPNESNISKYRGSSRYSESVLNPDSSVIEGLDDDEPYWDLLNKTSQDFYKKKKSGPSPNKSARKSNTLNETLTSESSTIPPIKKRKLLVHKNRKSTGDVFSQALDDSEPAVESEPVHPTNRIIKDHRKSYSQSEVVDRTHRSGFQSSESVSDTDRRAKRTIFKKPRRTSSSRVSVYENVLNETDVSAVGPSQPADDRRTFVKPRTTFSNSLRYSFQSKFILSQQSSNRDKDSDLDSDLDLASQQRPLFRRRARESGNPFASIISDSDSEKGVSQSQKSLEQSKRSQLESRREKELETEVEALNENEKSLSSVETKTSNSRNNSNNFVLRDSAGEHSNRQNGSRDSKQRSRSRGLSQLSEASDNKSSTTSISETYKSIENIPLDEKNYNSQDFETIGEIEDIVEPMETEMQVDKVLDQSQSQEIRANTVEEISNLKANFGLKANHLDEDEDEEVVDKENRESFNNLEEDVNVSIKKTPRKSESPKKSGKKIRITSDEIIASQQTEKIFTGALVERRRTRQSEGDSTRKSSQVQVELEKKSKKSVGRKSRNRTSEVDALASGVEVDKSLSDTGRKTRSGRVIQEFGTPEKSLGNKSLGKSSSKKSQLKTNDKVDLEKSMNESARKTRSGRVFKDLGGDFEEEDAERSKRMFEEKKKIVRNIFGGDSESESESESPEEVSKGQSKSLTVKKSLSRKEQAEKSRKSVGSQKGEEEEDESQDEEEENQETVESQENEEEISKAVESQEDEEESQEVENQEDEEEMSQEVENQDESEEEESEEREEAETEKRVESQEKEISRIESLSDENELIYRRKSSKLGSPKHSSTRYLNKTGKSLNESDSEEIDEEFHEYIKNTSKLSSSPNKSKHKEINPTPTDLPFRESDFEEDNLSEVEEATEVPRLSEVQKVRPSTSGVKKVNKNVESAKSHESKQFPGNQRSILSFFSNTTARPSLHISTKPLASSDLLKKVDTKMKEMKKRRDESFAKQMEEEIVTSKAKPVKLMPVKNKVASMNLIKKNVKTKEVDKAYIVDGKVYKKPRLPRPKHWATDRLYKFLWKKMEPKYDLQTRIKSEKFVQDLAKTVEVIIKKKKYDDYKFMLEELLKKMARLGIIVTRKDFYDFCYDFLPYEFREKVIPMLHPGAVHLVPFEPQKLNTPILGG